MLYHAVTDGIPPLQLLLSDNAATFFKHISEPLWAQGFKRMTATVGRDIYNLLSNILLLWAMLPHDTME